MTLLKHIIEQMKIQNEWDNSEYEDWKSAEYALEHLEMDYEGEVNKEEMEETKKALDKIISSNGKLKRDAIIEFNLKVNKSRSPNLL